MSMFGSEPMPQRPSVHQPSAESAWAGCWHQSSLAHISHGPNIGMVPSLAAEVAKNTSVGSGNGAGVGGGGVRRSEVCGVGGGGGGGREVSPAA